MNPKFAWLFLASALAAGVAAEDQIFKWRDAQGVWHFSSNAPEGVGAERVSIRHSQTVTAPKPVLTGENGQSADATKVTTAPGAVNGPQSANCKAAQDAVAVLSNNARVKMDSNGDGIEEELSAQQQLEELERRRAQARVYCAEA